MQRVTVVLDDELLEELDQTAARLGYANRSEALRDIARRGLRQAAEEVGGQGDCVAAVVYAYDSTQRGLGRRIAVALGERHDLVVAGLQVHLDHTNRFEVNVLRGPAAAVDELAGGIIAERGVRHGRVVRMPVDITHQRHGHPDEAHEHVHVRVRGGG